MNTAAALILASRRVLPLSLTVLRTGPGLGRRLLLLLLPWVSGAAWMWGGACCGCVVPGVLRAEGVLRCGGVVRTSCEGGDGLWEGGRAVESTAVGGQEARLCDGWRGMVAVQRKMGAVAAPVDAVGGVGTGVAAPCIAAVVASAACVGESTSCFEGSGVGRSRNRAERWDEV